MIYRIDPLSDRRWEALVERHPNSSVFHTLGWLEALRRTYGYEPVAYTTSPPQEELTNGLVFCRLSSWLTGKRLVSLPFSDHCDPLSENASSESVVYEHLRKERGNQDWKYIEIRSRNGVLNQQTGMEPGKSFCFHAIDLSCDEKTLFSKLHKDCIRRKVQRAEKEKLRYAIGCSGEFLKMFYELYVQNRRRQCIPPQPFRWFQNLSDCLGPAMQVRVVLQGDRLAASIVTLRFQRTLVYKYGCSDPQLNKLGGMPWLFWQTIREAKGMGLQELDLGRSDWDNAGLITFKARLGGEQSVLSYWQYPKPAAQTGFLGMLRRPAGWAMGHTPLPILTVAGRVLYRHIG